MCFYVDVAKMPMLLNLEMGIWVFYVFLPFCLINLKTQFKKKKRP